MLDLFSCRRTVGRSVLSRALIVAAASFAFVYQLQAVPYYMTPSGGSITQDGSSWENALPKTAMSTTLNTTMVAGDTLFIGSGNYPETTIRIDSDGTAALPKTITGVDTGSGIPHFNGDNWTRLYPTQGQDHILYVTGDYWVVENLELSRVEHAIKSANSSSNASNYITFRNLLIHDVRHGAYVYYMDNTKFENVVIQEYTKQGFRLDRGCDNVTFTNCVADMTAGDTSWWDYGEALPFGFVSYGQSSAKNSNIVFEDCVALNNRWNGQTDSNGDPESYYNGDGFVVEDNTIGITQFIRCVAVNNEDAGYDIKPTANFVGCVSVKNYRGFRLWHTAKTLNNCVAAYPFRRTTSNEVGVESSNGSGIWTQNGDSIVSNYTYFGNNGRGLDEDGSGSLTVSNSIIAFSGAEGSFKTGSVTLDGTTVQYRPGSGTDPLLFNPAISWNGIGDELDSEEFGHSKGYHSLSTPYEAESLIVIDSGEGNVLVSDASANGDELIRFDGEGSSDWVEFTVPNLPAGTYSVYVTDKTAANRGIYQLSVDGVDLGLPVDQYTSSDTYGEVAVGDVTLASDTSAAFRFTVTGKNASSSGYKLAIDTIRLALVGSDIEEPQFYDVVAEADTFVNDGNPTTNFGSDTRLLVKDTSPDYDRISYLRFTIPAAVDELVGAKLKLKVVVLGGEGSGARDIEIRQLSNDAWDESTMTWNTRESSSGTLIATIDARTLDELHEIDVSAYVSQELAGDGVVSFALVQPTNDNRLVGFGSRENVGQEPILELETFVATSTVSDIISEADLYVYDGAPSTNYGSTLGMAVKDGSSGVNRISYVRFPVSSITGSVQNATLKLKVKTIGGEGAGARYIEVRQLVNDAWDESTMTWNTRESSSGTLIATIDARTAGVVHEIDVSAYVFQEVAGDGLVSFALVQPDGNAKYVSIGTREDAGYEPILEVESSSALQNALIIDPAGLSDYASQTGTGSMTLSAGNTSIQLTGNYWRKYAYSYTVTANTVMEVTIDASDVGELTCIGFDSDNDFTTGLSHVKLAGTQVLNEYFSPITPFYIAGSGPETLVIPIGSFFTGSMSYLTFVGDDDGNSSINVTFSDIRIYESE